MSAVSPSVSGWRLAFWAIVVVQIAWLALAAHSDTLAATWSTAAFLALTLTLPVIGRPLAGWVLVLPAGFALLNLLGHTYDLYETLPPFDEIMHAGTAFAVCLPLSLIAHTHALPGFRRPTSLIANTLAIGLILGVTWEALEGTLMGLESLTSDTGTDLVLDAAGALAAGVVGAWLVREWPVG